MNDTLLSTALLGGGGSAAGLWLISDRSWAPRNILRLPPGHSVYAVDVDVEAGLIAAGTRSGRIVLIPWSGDDGGDEPSDPRSLYQGAPVLSVCLLGRSRLAAADAAGRCLLWPLGGDPPVPLILAGNGKPVCSLVRLSEDRLAGLSAGGKLLVWDLAASELADAVDVPAPPAKLALVRMTHWPAHEVLAFPARGGGLVLVDPASMATHVVEAHEDSFYAVISEGEQLHTMGTRDGLWKTWEGLPCTLQRQRQCPEGVVSAQGVEGADSTLLIVREDGSAAVFAGGTDGLELLQRLPGDSFRVAAGPSWAARAAWRRRQRELQAGQLRSEIVASIESGDLEGTDPLFGRLKALGFLALSLALRARCAETRGDILSELRVRRLLAGMLDHDDPRAAYSLKRFAELLIATWQLPPARRIYAELQAAGAVEEVPNWLTCAADVLSAEGWIAAPAMPLMPLIEAADVMERPFRGRWLLESSPPIVFPEANTSARAVAAKYEQVKAERELGGMPRAREENVWWVSPRQVHRASVVVFPPTDDQSPGLQMPAIRVLRRDLQCVVLPCVLFDAGWPNQDDPLAAHNGHNRALRRALVGRPGAEHAASWPRKLQQTVKLALRRLRTEALAPRPE